MPDNIEYHVNFYDTDAMGVVHHANYIRWFEMGRVAYLHKYGITLNAMMEDGFVFPITEVRAKYVSPGHFDDTLVIETRGKVLTKVKMAFTYRIFHKETGRLLVRGFTQNVFTDRETDRVTRLPKKYYALLAHAMEDEAAWLERQGEAETAGRKNA